MNEEAKRWETVRGSVTRKRLVGNAGPVVVEFRVEAITKDGWSVGQVVQVDAKRLDGARLDLYGFTLDGIVRNIEAAGPLR